MLSLNEQRGQVNGYLNRKSSKPGLVGHQRLYGVPDYVRRPRLIDVILLTFGQLALERPSLREMS